MLRRRLFVNKQQKLYDITTSLQKGQISAYINSDLKTYRYDT